MKAPVAVRWTIGDVAPFGFEALRLSIHGARRLFGRGASFTVVVNSMDPGDARRRTGAIPPEVAFVPAGNCPDFLFNRLGPGMAEGVGWKFAPLRLHEDRYEISLDNDCILHELPAALSNWLDEPDPRCVIAADVKVAFGRFAHLTRPEPRNAGIRGLPPGFDLGRALSRVLDKCPVDVATELDEQGLQVVALDLDRPAHVVSLSDVSICSPFWPHQPELGRCGAHFVGLNSCALPFSYYGRPATTLVRENWLRHRPELCRRVGLEVADG